MKKRNTIYTCYGCPYYHRDKGSIEGTMYCGQDYILCPWYLGTGEPLGKKKEKKENGMS